MTKAYGTGARAPLILIKSRNAPARRALRAPRPADQSLLPGSTERAHRFQTAIARFRACRFDSSDQRFANRADAAEPQNTAAQRLQAVGTEEPAIGECRHAHRDDDPRRPALEQAPRHSVGANIVRKARAEYLLEARLQDRRHHAEPEWMDDQHVIGPEDRLLGLANHVGWRLVFVFLLAVQKWKIELRDVDAPHC